MAPNSPIFSALPPRAGPAAATINLQSARLSLRLAPSRRSLPDGIVLATPIKNKSKKRPDREQGSDDDNHACGRARRGASRFRPASTGLRPAISEQAGEDHHPVPGGRRHRSRRAADCAEAVGKAWATVLHREHRRRRRQSRHGPGRARPGRRLHRPAVVFERHGEPEPLPQDAVRRGEGPRSRSPRRAAHRTLGWSIRAFRPRR